MKRPITSIILAAAALTATARPIVAPQGGKAISDKLIGIFFEDISHSADGGLNAELVQNGSFEYNVSEKTEWGPGTAWSAVRPGHSLGHLEARQASPLNQNNPNYMRVHVERVGHYADFNGWTGYGLLNKGFAGMRVTAGKRYDVSLFARTVSGSESFSVRILLGTPGRGCRVIADTTINVKGGDWKKYSCTLVPSEDCADAELQLLVLNVGAVDVDDVSLIPQDTYHGHGLRRDLAEALEALHPSFMRFPGGCIVHGGGDGMWDTYRWKNTVGPKEQRKSLKNCWGYHQSFGLGYYEYFQLCEDMGAEPLPILPCGVSCQGANGGWGMRGFAQDAVPMDSMDEWVQDALDLIEWANGDATTKWGRVRAEAGHPEPFHLKYLGLGNEEHISPEFIERFKLMYKAVSERYPDIIIVGTAGPGSHPSGGTFKGDYENGWALAEELGMPIIDEHYYEKRDYFFNSRQYDSYPRDRKTKVYLGEYAAKDKKLLDALAEAVYLLHVERNGDVVAMTSYAPLFARKGNTNWNPDLIYFDNEKPYLTCSYYVQQMFGLSAGNYYYGDCVSIDGYDDKYIGQSVVLNVSKRELYIKAVNATADARTASIDLSRFKSMKKKATVTTLSGQPDDENNFDAQPVKPATKEMTVGKKTTVDLQPYSFTMITVKL
jgi:alpha-L-arabinofuranosidase